MTLHYSVSTKTVEDIVRLHANQRLVLNPQFQRQSVWGIQDRVKLIESLGQGYPIPSLFLRENINDQGEIIYEVVDGKQRIESILMFCGAMKGKFEASFVFAGEEEESHSITSLKKIRQQNMILGRKISVIEINGDMAEIVDLFVRINSTGKPLSAQEKRNAKFHTSGFLGDVVSVADKLKKFFKENKILKATHIDRMKHIELVCELLLSIEQKDVIGKKSALDEVMRDKKLKKSQFNKFAAALRKSIGRLIKIIPELRASRFRKLADFYSIVILLVRLDDEGLTLTDTRALRRAGILLSNFEREVYKVPEDLKANNRVDRGSLALRYWRTTQATTDDPNRRREREFILRQIIATAFSLKDRKRIFPEAHRNQIWLDSSRSCYRCKKNLKFEEMTIDHKVPHSHGGRTIFSNAAVMCRSCNSRKGARLI